LEASYLIVRLQPYHRKRLVKTPTLYFLDSGLMAWLLGIQSADSLAIHAQRGHLFESFVVSEFIKQPLQYCGLEGAGITKSPDFRRIVQPRCASDSLLPLDAGRRDLKGPRPAPVRGLYCNLHRVLKMLR
jgi:hypothetical protein